MINFNTIIQNLLKIPYKHNGRDKNGIDCYGLLILFYKLYFNKEIIDIWNYDYDWARKGENYFIENYHKQWKRIDKPKVGDGVLFKNHKGICDHVGVWIDDNKILHTSRAGTAITRISNMNRKVEGYFRLKNDKI